MREMSSAVSRHCGSRSKWRRVGPWFLMMASRKVGLRDCRQLEEKGWGEHLEDEEVLVGVSPFVNRSLGEGVADLGGVGTAGRWVVWLVLLTR